MCKTYRYITQEFVADTSNPDLRKQELVLAKPSLS